MIASSGERSRASASASWTRCTIRIGHRRVSHAYVVTSATARFLTLHTPAGFEQFATEVGEPAQALTLPPPPAGPPDFAALVQAAARHQITILAPPPQP